MTFRLFNTIRKTINLVVAHSQGAVRPYFDPSISPLGDAETLVIAGKLNIDSYFSSSDSGLPIEGALISAKLRKRKQFAEKSILQDNKEPHNRFSLRSKTLNG